MTDAVKKRTKTSSKGIRKQSVKAEASRTGANSKTAGKTSSVVRKKTPDKNKTAVISAAKKKPETKAAPTVKKTVNKSATNKKTRSDAEKITRSARNAESPAGKTKTEKKQTAKKTARATPVKSTTKIAAKTVAKKASVKPVKSKNAVPKTSKKPISDKSQNTKTVKTNSVQKPSAKKTVKKAAKKAVNKTAEISTKKNVRTNAKVSNVKTAKRKTGAEPLVKKPTVRKAKKAAEKKAVASENPKKRSLKTKKASAPQKKNPLSQKGRGKTIDRSSTGKPNKKKAEILGTPEQAPAPKPRKKAIRPISSAVFRGQESVYDFKVFDLKENPGKVSAVYVISRRKTDKRKRGHHSLVCIGQADSIAEAIKAHRKSKCLRQHDANAISILREENENERLKIANDLKAAHSISCNRG